VCKTFATKVAKTSASGGGFNRPAVAISSAPAAMVNAGSLDDRSWVAPKSEIYCDSAQPWVRLGGELMRFAKTPI
jgi:hypothetical protein